MMNYGRISQRGKKRSRSDNFANILPFDEVLHQVCFSSVGREVTIPEVHECPGEEHPLPDIVVFHVGVQQGTEGLPVRPRGEFHLLGDGQHVGVVADGLATGPEQQVGQGHPVVLADRHTCVSQGSIFGWI